MAGRKRVRNADGSYTSESLMGIELRHHPEKGTVSIELSEAAVLMLYLSGIAVLISGISLGCCLWQRNQHKRDEACECPCCSCVCCCWCHCCHKCCCSCPLCWRCRWQSVLYILMAPRNLFQ